MNENKISCTCIEGESVPCLVHNPRVSPVPQKSQAIVLEKMGIPFPEALKAVIDGKKITKLEWNNPNIYGVFADDILRIHKGEGDEPQWIINSGDLFGEDWVVLE